MIYEHNLCCCFHVTGVNDPKRTGANIKQDVSPLTFSTGVVKFSSAGNGLGSWCLGTVLYCVPPSGDNNQSTKAETRRDCRDDQAVCCTDYTEEVKVLQEKGLAEFRIVWLCEIICYFSLVNI